MQRRQIVRSTLSLELLTFKLESNALRNRGLQNALGTFDFELLLANRHRNTFRQRDYFFANARHN
jgi:hypothetical protein